MKKIALVFLFSMFFMFLLSYEAKAQGALEMKDTYFHRFYYRSIIMGTNSVGKYNLDYLNGKEASAIGFILDFPNNFMNRLVKYDNISQTAGILFYGFEDELANKGFDEISGDSIHGTAMTALSVCYGWNIYDLPGGINIFTGFNLYSGSKKLFLDSGDESKDKFFAPAPYFYMTKPWKLGFLQKASKFLTFFDLMVAQDYKELSKMALTAMLERTDGSLSFANERNGSEYNDSYVSSFKYSKRFGSAWFFKNVVGIFSSSFRSMDDEALKSFEDMDKILNKPGYINMQLGTAFNVNNLANEKVGDKIGDVGNYFGKLEFGWILGTGFSYKVEEGFGWKIGLNYSIDIDAAGGSSNSGDEKMNKMLKGKMVHVRLEYYNNYINDDVLGLRIDPSMFRINLMIR